MTTSTSPQVPTLNQLALQTASMIAAEATTTPTARSTVQALTGGIPENPPEESVTGKAVALLKEATADSWQLVISEAIELLTRESAE